MELTIATIAFVIAAGLLVITIIIEYIENSRYRAAAQAVIAFGEGMQISYNKIVELVQKTIVQGNKNRKVTLKHADRLVNIEHQQQFVSMALNTVAMQNLLQQQEMIADGKDTKSEIQGT